MAQSMWLLNEVLLLWPHWWIPSQSTLYITWNRYGPTALLTLLIRIIKITVIKRNLHGRCIKPVDFNGLWKFLLLPSSACLESHSGAEGVNTHAAASTDVCPSCPHGTHLPTRRRASFFFLSWTACAQLFLLYVCPSTYPWNPPSLQRGGALITSVVFLWSPPFVPPLALTSWLLSFWWGGTPFNLCVLGNSWLQPVGSSYSLRQILLPSLSAYPFPMTLWLLVPGPTSTTSLRVGSSLTYI